MQTSQAANTALQKTASIELGDHAFNLSRTTTKKGTDESLRANRFAKTHGVDRVFDWRQYTLHTKVQPSSIQHLSPSKGRQPPQAWNNKKVFRNYTIKSPLERHLRPHENPVGIMQPWRTTTEQMVLVAEKKRRYPERGAPTCCASPNNNSSVLSCCSKIRPSLCAQMHEHYGKHTHTNANAPAGATLLDMGPLTLLVEQQRSDPWAPLRQKPLPLPTCLVWFRNQKTNTFPPPPKK